MPEDSHQSNLEKDSPRYRPGEETPADILRAAGQRIKRILILILLILAILIILVVVLGFRSGYANPTTSPQNFTYPPTVSV
jgi:hypothetical protein